MSQLLNDLYEFWVNRIKTPVQYAIAGAVINSFENRSIFWEQRYREASLRMQEEIRLRRAAEDGHRRVLKMVEHKSWTENRQLIVSMFIDRFRGENNDFGRRIATLDEVIHRHGADHPYVEKVQMELWRYAMVDLVGQLLANGRVNSSTRNGFEDGVTAHEFEIQLPPGGILARSGFMFNHREADLMNIRHGREANEGIAYDGR